MGERVRITELGRKADGVAELNGARIHVPLTLPHEEVEVSGSGSHRLLQTIHKPSPNRIEPICPHFGVCGGCQTQHISNSSYMEWKFNLLREALTRSGIELMPEPIVQFDTASRRRVVFNAKWAGGKLLFGFSGRRSHTIVPIDSCSVLSSNITAKLDDLRQLAQVLGNPKKPYRISVLSTQTGLDVSFYDVGNIKETQRSRAIEAALKFDIARLSLDNEILVEARKPLLNFSGHRLVPAPGSFVQAIEDTEQAMVSLVCEHLADCKQVADLYCGMGTFALRLAQTSTVYGAETSKPAVEALDQAWRDSGGTLKKITTEVRNLERRPLSIQELKNIDGLVFDPPRAGAEAQSRQIAKSQVRKIVAVSCNPATLARDLAVLLAGGYEIRRIVPLDQFKFTPHLEVVTLLERSKK